MDNPVISIFAGANRPELWMNFYEHVSKNDTPLEIVFAGNVRPEFDLPENFHFIYTPVKPSQSYYIASMNCKGEYMVSIMDDYTYEENCFDRLLEECKKDEKNIIAPKLFHFDKKIMHNLSLGFWGTNEGKILPSTSFCSKKLWDDLKGIDNRFVGMYWDVDIAMMVYEQGGTVIECDNTACFERNARGLKGRLCCLPDDKPFFYSLWHTTGNPKTGEFLPKRRDEVRQFEWTDNILEISQGTKHQRWP